MFNLHNINDMLSVAHDLIRLPDDSDTKEAVAAILDYHGKHGYMKLRLSQTEDEIIDT